jgi:hypothetical protein
VWLSSEKAFDLFDRRAESAILGVRHNHSRSPAIVSFPHRKKLKSKLTHYPESNFPAGAAVYTLTC